MSEKIKTKLPKNISENFLWVFKRREFYRYPKLKVKEKHNVFLSHYGIILKNMLPIRYTLPNAWNFTKPNAGFILQFYKKVLETYLVCRYGKSLKAITLDPDKNYLFVHSPWFGYFSWVTESIPRIIKTEDQHQNLKLIIPASYSKKSFVKESLELFPNLRHEIIPEGVHLFIPHVTIPELNHTYV